ncbi:MAG TPA: hypothetical protein VNJ02_16575 [Vicinamibacterales bacterium]|nr:hypothetical protein [Vicinamibacterales bacterium]
MRGVRWLDAVLIVSWFAASRVIAASAGLAPDRSVPEILWQLLPLDLLESRLVESVWHLHSQPPLFNIFVGLLLKLPGDYLSMWRILWVVIGVAFPLTVFSCLRAVGARRWLAHMAALLLGLNPTLLLYENFYFYSYPEALLVLLAFLTLLPGRDRAHRWTGYAWATSLLALMRATFQPIWALGVVIVTVWSSPKLARRHWLGLAAPLIVGALLAARNGVVFDVWTSSSWYGMNVAKLTVTAMLGETPALVARGVVSPTFAVGPFQPVEMYDAAMVRSAEREIELRHGNVEALRLKQKPNGQPNFNHLIYRDVSRQLSADSVAVVRERSVLFEETVIKGFRTYTQPASLYVFVDANRRYAGWLETLYTAVLYPGGSLLLVQLALLLTLLTSGAIALLEGHRFAALRPAAGYVLVTVLWVTVASNLAEYGENNRLRFTLDPLMATWLAVLLAGIRDQGSP